MVRPLLPSLPPAFAPPVASSAPFLTNPLPNSARSQYTTPPRYLFGFAFAFGRTANKNDRNRFIGNYGFALTGYNDPANFGPFYGLPYFFWTFAYAITCNGIISSAIGGRASVLTHVLSTAYTVGFLYPVAAHWVNSDYGWLSNIKSFGKLLGNTGAIDVAAAGPVHLVGATISLCASLFLSKFDNGPGAAAPEGDQLVTSSFFTLVAAFAYISSSAVNPDLYPAAAIQAAGASVVAPEYAVAQAAGRAAINLTMCVAGTTFLVLVLEAWLNKEVRDFVCCLIVWLLFSHRRGMWRQRAAAVSGRLFVSPIRCGLEREKERHLVVLGRTPTPKPRPTPLLFTLHPPLLLSLPLQFHIVHVYNAIIAGFVTITSNCQTCEPWAALLAGFVTALLYVYGRHFFRGLRDNDVFVIHGLSAAWGLVFTGLMAKPLLIRNTIINIWYGGIGKIGSDSDGRNPYYNPKHSGVFYPQEGVNGKLLGAMLLEVSVLFGWSLIMALPLFGTLFFSRQLAEKDRSEAYKTK